MNLQLYVNKILINKIRKIFKYYEKLKYKCARS